MDQILVSNAQIEDDEGYKRTEVSILRKHAAFPAASKAKPDQMQSRARTDLVKIRRWQAGIKRLREELEADA